MKDKSVLIRSIIGILLGVLLIFASVTVAKRLSGDKDKPKQLISKQINSVYTQTVANQQVPVIIQEKGSLQALRKVELYSEVQGILNNGNRLFKPGQAYNKGSVILSIDDSEFRASLVAQKSVLYNLIAQIMPDLKLDYPDIFIKWQDYLSSFDIQQSVPTLPEFSSDKEKFFINSKTIVTTYYNIKNLEERHQKYRIYSPFYGVITEALVNPGALVRPGQKLGTILSPSAYELPISINESYKSYVTIGKEVKLYNLDRSKSWTGKVARINATLNAETQGIEVFIAVRGKDLKEGMFLEAEIDGEAIDNAYEISRKLLIENNKTYVLRDSTLQLVDLDIAFYKKNTAVVTNLKDSTIILKYAIPAAYEGMVVEVAEDSNN